MTDRDRDDIERDDIPEDDEGFEAPPPATWAGRRGNPDEEEPGELGLTEEFDRVGEEFSAEFEDDDSVAEEDYDFHEDADPEDDGEDGVDWEDVSADEREVPPDEFEFVEDELEEEGELEVEEEFATSEHEAASADEPQDPAQTPEAPGPATEAHDALADRAADDGDEAAAPEDAAPAPDDEAAAPEAEAPAPALAAAAAAAASGETIEADTLALADEEEEREAREKAHAALAARAAERTQTHTEETPPAPPAPAAPEVRPDPPPEEVGPAPKRRLWLRFVAGSLVIVTAMAVATSVSLLVYLTDIAEGLGDNEQLEGVQNELSAAGGGDPQTILILGSDSREDPEVRGKGKGIQDARSDTTMLLRVDPPNDAIRLLSLPRDLKVRIPGLGAEEKLNAAYSYGGPQLTLKTVQKLLPDIEINHIVNVDFEGFYDAVNAIGCVYVDVDRHYYNPVGGEYDDIDIEAGYNKLCGYRALDYVRYRHRDNDLVRGARQQDFLREARQRIPPSKLVSDRNELIGIFTKYTSSDIDDPITLLEVLKTIVAARNANVRQIDFQGGVGPIYVESTAEQLEAMTEQFLADAPDTGGEAGGGKGKKSKKKKGKSKKPKDEQPVAPQAPELWDATGLAVPFAEQFDRYMRKKKANFPIFYPTLMVPGSTITNESRTYGVPDFDDEHIFRGYKFVFPYQEGGFTSYYGVTGVNWDDPPILNNPSETRRIDGRDYLLFYDGDRLRLVGWQTKHGSYWVINTLTRALSEEQMLAIATSTEKF